MVDVGAAAGLLDSLESNPATIVAFIGSGAFTLGMIVLAVGLLQAHTAPAWSGWLLAIGVLAAEVAGWISSDPLAIAGVAAMFLGLAPLGYELLVEPDEAWEHPARFEGFKPVIGTG